MTDKLFNVEQPIKQVSCAEDGCDGCNFYHYAEVGERIYTIDGAQVSRDEWADEMRKAAAESLAEFVP